MRIAIVGGGISGIACASRLNKFGIETTLFEAAPRLGGHTDTHAVENPTSKCGYDLIDTGFIIFNPKHYPLFSKWLAELGVASHTTDMSFAVRDDVAGIEYGTDRLATMLCQPSNLVKPEFWSLWRDLTRFYRSHATIDAIAAVPDKPLRIYLRANGYGRSFTDSHLLPMCAALWSQPRRAAADLDARTVIEFMHNHQLLELTHRPVWSVISGGSSTYVDAFLRNYSGEVRLNEPITSVRRSHGHVQIVGRNGSAERFDQVVLACHSDQALALLANPTRLERQQLSTMPYQNNRVFLHSDPTFMPRRRRAWSSWNVIRDAEDDYTISYWMNRLQGLNVARNYFVTLNPKSSPAQTHWAGHYEHPVFGVTNRNIALPNDPSSRVLFAGAYLGNGFHESGFETGDNCAKAIANTLKNEQVLSHAV